MKVKIKSINELKGICGSRWISGGGSPTPTIGSVYFTYEMMSFCNKEIELVFYNNVGSMPKIYKEKGQHGSYSFQNWMFDVIPEIEKKTIFNGVLMIEINDIRIEKTEFKGKKYVSIRKWYTGAEGIKMPSKNGINMSVEEWKMFVEKFEEIKKELK